MDGDVLGFRTERQQETILTINNTHNRDLSIGWDSAKPGRPGDDLVQWLPDVIRFSMKAMIP